MYNPRPRPRQALLSVARRNGKSLLGTPLALYHLLADGEEAAEVLLASSDQRTAEVIFRLARRMVGLDERMTGVCQLFQDRIYRPASDSVLEPLLRSSVRDQLALLLAEHPARAVTMAWREVDAPPVSVPLILTTREKTALNRNYFNTFVWKVALATAGPSRPARYPRSAGVNSLSTTPSGLPARGRVTGTDDSSSRRRRRGCVRAASGGRSERL